MNQADLKSKVDYHPEGYLTWRVSHTGYSAGNRVGSKHPTGYYQAMIEGKTWRLHRLVFLYHHGYLPKEIDHINGDKGDNRIENLRPVTRAQNAWNTKGWSGNKNVDWIPSRKRWRVMIMKEGKHHFGGYFKNEQDAIDKASKMRYELHGEYARV